MHLVSGEDVADAQSVGFRYESALLEDLCLTVPEGRSGHHYSRQRVLGPFGIGENALMHAAEERLHGGRGSGRGHGEHHTARDERIEDVGRAVADAAFAVEERAVEVGHIESALAVCG